MKPKKDFLENSKKTLSNLYDFMSALPRESFSGFMPDKTMLVIIDMVNGFVKSGSMSSDRVLGINQKIADFSEKCTAAGIQKIAFADSHSEESPEFLSYPIHCLKNSAESTVTDEIACVGGYELIEKNSTNGFIEPLFQRILSQQPEVDSFIVVGDCTDICIEQFAKSLKTDFNRRNTACRVVVPVNLVETYDGGMHDGDLMNIVSLYSMSLNGIELVADII